jgi:hypothetical protein
VSLTHVSREGDPRCRARAEGDLEAGSAERAGGRRNRLPPRSSSSSFGDDDDGVRCGARLV